MVEEVVFFKHSEKVQNIYDKLMACKHNGFPVVNQHKQVVGLISRNHLVTAIENQYFKTLMATSPD
jgi:predicted transcriptional regulator